MTPGERGQATVELVALLPLMLAMALAGATVLAGHAAGEQAGQAAEAGAIVLLQGGDPQSAARRALPESARNRATIEITRGRVDVHLRPRVPIAALARPLTAHATAAAGPAP